MRKTIAALALVVLAGCGTLGPAELEGRRPVLSRTLYDGEGNVASRLEVSIEGEIYARGCQALEIDREGDVSYLMQQDASSDYATVRGLVTIVPETVAVAMNPLSSAIDAIVLALGGRQQIPEPSRIHGCDNLFTAAAEE